MSRNPFGRYGVSLGRFLIPEGADKVRVQGECAKHGEGVIEWRRIRHGRYVQRVPLCCRNERARAYTKRHREEITRKARERAWARLGPTEQILAGLGR
jgi:hypothetical protein